MFKVGDRVKGKGGYIEIAGVRRPQPSVFDAPATITEMTDRGFKYRYDTPIFLGSRIGTCEGGETYEPDMWELEEEIYDI